MIEGNSTFIQVIWCRLAGIRPKQDVWTDTDSDLIYDEIDKYHQSLYAFRVPDAPELKSKFFEININRCDVVLVATEDTDQINLNLLLASADLAKLDDEFDTKIMDKIPFVEPEEDWESLQFNAPDASDTFNAIQRAEVEPAIDMTGEMFDNFTDEDIAALFQPSVDQNMRAIEPVVQAIEPAMQTKPKPTESIDSSRTEFNEKTIQPPTKGQMVYNHKRPLVCWRQDKQWIVLTIKADDRVKYNLRVTEDYLIYRHVDFVSIYFGHV